MPEADAAFDPDRLFVRELIENWAIWRDALMWERFRMVWHDDGRMMATWFQGAADEFIRASREACAYCISSAGCRSMSRDRGRSRRRR